MRHYAVLRAASVTRDLAAIRRHLISAYEAFGDTRETAAARAAERLHESFTYMQSFAAHPHRGTVHPDLMGGIRHVTHRNFIYYFELDESNAAVRILAVFFGGTDHRRQIAERLAR